MHFIVTGSSGRVAYVKVYFDTQEAKFTVIADGFTFARESFFDLNYLSGIIKGSSNMGFAAYTVGWSTQQTGISTVTSAK